MAPRAYWKGHIRLALVSFPVRLYAAVTTTERISLHRIHRESGERVRMQNYVPDEGPVDSDDIVMGYEYDRDRYIPVEDEELEGLEIESKHTIDLSRFVDLSDIDPIYFDKPYFVAPDGNIATEAFVTIRDALRHSKKVALGQIVLSKRERVVAIQPCGKGLLLETLRWADEVREAGAYFDDIEDVDSSTDQVEMAESLIKARAGEFEPDEFVDRYQAALRALIEKKLKGQKTVIGKPSEDAGKRSNVINLMDALKASLEDGKGGKAASGTTRGRSPKSQASAPSPSRKSTKARGGSGETGPAKKPAAASRTPKSKAAASKAAPPKTRQKKSA